MPRGGSRKGEHRGNAKSAEMRGQAKPVKPAKPAKPAIKPKRPRNKVAHETPNEIMRDAFTQPRGGGLGMRGQGVRTIEHRIELSRVIMGDTGRVRDMTPKEVIMDNMHYFMQAAYDWQGMLGQLAVMQPSNDMPQDAINKAVERAENEIAMARNIASEHAHKVAPFIHPRLAAFKMVGGNEGDNPEDIVAALLDDVDERMRNARQINPPSPKKGQAA